MPPPTRESENNWESTPRASGRMKGIPANGPGDSPGRRRFSIRLNAVGRNIGSTGVRMNRRKNRFRTCPLFANLLLFRQVPTVGWSTSGDPVASVLTRGILLEFYASEGFETCSSGRFITRLCLFLSVEFSIDFHASEGYETGSTRIEKEFI